MGLSESCVAAPEPPTNLTVALSRNKQATIAWAPPAHGDYTGFRFKVIVISIIIISAEGHPLLDISLPLAKQTGSVPSASLGFPQP